VLKIIFKILTRRIKKIIVKHPLLPENFIFNLAAYSSTKAKKICHYNTA